MPAGRPTKYTDLLIAKSYKYTKIYEDLGDAIPSHSGLAEYLDIKRSTMYDWAKQKSKREFSDILEKIKNSQERRLLNLGLTGKFNANIVKLALGKHGYHDKQDQTLSNLDGSPVVNEWHIHPVTNAREGDNERSPPS